MNFRIVKAIYWKNRKIIKFSEVSKTKNEK